MKKFYNLKARMKRVNSNNEISTILKKNNSKNGLNGRNSGSKNLERKNLNQQN